MATVTVVGSGPSGVHFADALLDQGHSVRLFDVGVAPTEPVEPDASMEGLKGVLADPAAYFLGERFESVIQPDHADEYYGLPPSKRYVFEGTDGLDRNSTGISPLFSHARGGLAQAWTGGSYPFNDGELADFPFGYDELAPHYGRVAGEIGVNGVEDDLTRFFPLHDGLGRPLRMDGHSRRLAERYAARKGRLNERLGMYLGRSRIAVLSEESGDRHACGYLGRCLWGCPRRSLYTPSMTLERLLSRPGFEYLPGRMVKRFEVDADGWVRGVVWTAPGEVGEHQEPVEVLALAAGTLPSARIFIDSWRSHRGDGVRLGGLMDNRQILVPFLSLGRVGVPFEPDEYQYNQLAMGLSGDREAEYVHCLVTTLTTATVHPVVQSLPVDLRTAGWMFRHIRAALGIVNVNFHDDRRGDCFVEPGPDPSGPLRIVYSPPEAEPARVRSALARLRRGMAALGAIVPPPMTKWRPMGSSVHYSGTLPMSASDESLTTDEHCRSRDFPNLFVVDGSTFPFLPAKNLTFTLMANARRVAEVAFRGGEVRL